MANKKMEWYLENNDFEGAKERFDGTTPAWKSRWFAVCEKIFNACADWATKYVLDPIAKTIHAISDSKPFRNSKRKSIYDTKIMVSDECGSLLDEAHQKCYLFEFLNESNVLVCSKVGTTIRTVIERLKKELQSATYKDMGATKAIIRRVYDCGDIPAEGLESYFRAKYIRRYPDSFKKNDRFINVKFDFAEADKIYAEYMELA